MANIFARQRQLIGTTADWAANNIVLGNGEIGFERTTDSDYLVKCGDGVKTWSQLPYISSTAMAAAVQRPLWVGKSNGWPDPFFQKFNLTTLDIAARRRWRNRTAGDSATTGWSYVSNSYFNGGALRRSANINNAPSNGPVIWLDEMGAVAGDIITAYVLATGDGAVIQTYAFFTQSNYVQIGGTLQLVSSTGGTSITSSATPQWLRISVTVPSNAAYLLITPFTLTASKTFDVISLWAFKGAANAGPEWPSLTPSVADQEARLSSAESSLATMAPSVAYGFDTYGIVTAASTSITVDGTGFASVARDLSFRGWGERYSPAGVSFNALRIKAISRTAALETSRWRTLRIVVRTGANSASSGATVVAVGSTIVVTTSDTLTDVTFLLKDPTTGATKTLTDADFSGGEYFIGVYAENISGAAAACGEPRGTLANSLGQGYYITSSGGDPRTASWVATVGASNAREGFQHLLLTTPVEGVGVAPTQKMAGDLASVTALSPEIVLPPSIFGVQGRECNVYFDNLHLSDAGEYWHDVTSASSTGQQQNERWTWTPSGALTSGTVSIAVYDKRTGLLLTSKTAQQRAAASNSGSGLNKKVLMIGDSLVNAGTITQTLLDVASTDVMGVTLLGTRGTAPNRHEGRGGWTVAFYTGAGPTYRRFTVSGVSQIPSINSTEYTDGATVYRVQEVAISGGSGTVDCSIVSGPNTPAASGTLTKSNGSAGDASITYSAIAAVAGNPFWIGGAVNFAQYLTNNSISTPDWVFIALGINDCFSQTDDVACSSFTDGELSKLDTLIASIKAADANVKVGLLLPTPPSSDQDAFGSNYATGQTRWRFKRNILIWSRQMIAKYTGQEASRVYLVPSNTALDTVNNMSVGTSAPVNSRSTVSRARQNNGVHPASSGYQQIGDAVWSFLKYYG